MPKVVDHEQKRAELAQAVWRVVGRRGLDAATVREIAAEARCSTGTIVHYFADKDGALVYALRLAGERAGERMRRAAAQTDGVVALRAALHEALPLDAGRRREWGVWLGFWGRSVGDPRLAREHARRHDERREIVRALVLAAQEMGELRADVAAVRVADTLTALVDGIGLQAALDPKRLTPDRQVSLLDRHLQTLVVPVTEREAAAEL